MQLDEEYWHNAPIGEEVLFKHRGCSGNTANLYVRRTLNGYFFYCHSCTYKGFQPIKTYSSIKQTILTHNKNQLIDSSVDKQGNIILPKDFQNKIPIIGMNWLRKYGITNQETLKFNIGYSECYNRIILPVYSSEGRLIYWQGRNLGVVDRENPKYINIRSKVKNVFFIRNTTIFNFNCCIVEDILSAIKCGRIVDSIAILGSYINDDLLTILREYKKIFIYLDYDKRVSSIKYAQRITSLLGVDAFPIIHQEDPKACSMAQLQKFIGG